MPRLFGEVLIPPAVERELRRFHASLPEFLRVVAPADQRRLLRLVEELDLGEAEAILSAKPDVSRQRAVDQGPV